DDQSTCVKNTRSVLDKEIGILDELNVARKVSRLHLGNLSITLSGSTQNNLGTAGSYEASIDVKGPGHQDVITIHENQVLSACQGDTMVTCRNGSAIYRESRQNDGLTKSV